jgi:hypothetical protein
MIGFIVLKEFVLENSEIGIYNTDVLLGLMSSLDEEIQIETTKKGEKFTSLKMYDDVVVFDFVISPVDIIPKTPQIKKIHWDLDFVINKVLMDRFLKSYNSYYKTEKNREVVFYSDENGELKITFGYSTQNTNQITISTGLISENRLKHYLMNSLYLRSIFVNNKDYDTMRIKISNEGLLNISGESDLYSSDYYMMMKAL